MTGDSVDGAGRRWCSVPSPVGPLTVVAVGNALRELWFAPVDERQQARMPGGTPVNGADDVVLSAVAREIEEYFTGQRRQFDVAVDPVGGDFEQRVWARLLAIPYGETVSYGSIAADLGEPGAAQAVGRAVGANPIGLIVPCHRVIGADGSMTGFAGGLACKTYLLDLEGYESGRTLLPPRPL